MSITLELLKSFLSFPLGKKEFLNIWIKIQIFLNRAEVVQYAVPPPPNLQNRRPLLGPFFTTTNDILNPWPYAFSVHSREEKRKKGRRDALIWRKMWILDIFICLAIRFPNLNAFSGIIPPNKCTGCAPIRTIFWAQGLCTYLDPFFLSFLCFQWKRGAH